MDQVDGTMAVAAQDGQPSGVLVVAGTDSSGGAGLSRDIETIARHGMPVAIAVTAVTAQTDRRVVAVEPLPPKLVARQMEAALECRAIGAIKIGMLATEDTVKAVVSVLKQHSHIPAVLDPVLVSSSGGTLLEPKALVVLKRELMPLCHLVTPNWLELAVLNGSAPAEDEKDAISQAKDLLEKGCGALLVKGGHAPDGKTSTDILLRRFQPPLRFEAERIKATLRGSGCRLSSAIAAHLALQRSLEESIAHAKSEILLALRESFKRNAGCPGGGGHSS